MASRKSPAAGAKPAASSTAPAPDVAATIVATPGVEPAPSLPAPVPVPVRTSIDELVDAVVSGDDRASRSGIEVVAFRDSRRRAGLAFGREAIVIRLDTLDEEQLRAIDADPELSWAVVRLDAPEDD